MRRNSLVIITLLTLCTFRVQADESISIRDRFPTQGQSTLIHIRDENGHPVKGAKVAVTYRPESKVEKTIDLGITGEAGTIRWIPEDAGVAAINAQWSEGEKNSSKVISIKFPSTPAGGILIMVLAGLLLIGGSVVRFIRFMRSPGAN